MAIKIDNDLLLQLGLATLPEAEKNSLLRHIYETLEMRVGMRLADQMTNEQLDEFEKYFDAKDDAGAFKWLEANFPNYKEIVQQEFDKLKLEIGQSAPQILAASQQAPAVAPQAAATPAPAQPAPQQPQPVQQQSTSPAAALQQPQTAPQPPQPPVQQPIQPYSAPAQPAPQQPQPSYPQYPSQQQPAVPQQPVQQPYQTPQFPQQQPPAGPGQQPPSA